MRPLFVALAVPAALAVLIVVLVVSGALPLSSDGNDPHPRSGAARVDRFARAAGSPPPRGRGAARAARSEGAAASRLLRMRVPPGPRPAGPGASRKLAERLRGMLPN